jgi:hypothetical protein
MPNKKAIAGRSISEIILWILFLLGAAAAIGFLIIKFTS